MTSAGNVTTSDDVVEFSGASFTATINFTAVDYTGKVLRLVHRGTSLTQKYTLATTAGQTIDGIASGSYVLTTNGETLVIYSDGTNWQKLSHDTFILPQSYTPTGNGFGTLSNVSFHWHRQGKYMIINGSCQLGTVSASTARITIPSNAALDTNYTGTAQNRSFGVHFFANTTTASIPGSNRGAWAVVYESGQTGSLSISTSTDTDTAIFLLENGSISHTSNGWITWQNVMIPISDWQV
jgi:hypothetical protein